MYLYLLCLHSIHSKDLVFVIKVGLYMLANVSWGQGGAKERRKLKHFVYLNKINPLLP